MSCGLEILLLNMVIDIVKSQHKQNLKLNLEEVLGGGGKGHACPLKWKP